MFDIVRMTLQNKYYIFSTHNNYEPSAKKHLARRQKGRVRDDDRC